MSGPSQRSAERGSARRAPSSRTGTKRTGRVSSAAAAVRDRPSLTGRAVILASVVVILVVTLAVPVRELVHQRGEINALRAENAAAQARVDDLLIRQQRLKDPAYVVSLVRERLHYLLPGEIGYVVTDVIGRVKVGMGIRQDLSAVPGTVRTRFLYEAPRNT